jgi:glycosyltransferase involved in cell wall biosynthesis
MKPLVSILIPAYNAEVWIADTIQSALAQTWAYKEIIIVDDGSKDGTLTVARRFVSPQVSVITQENQGAATARNQALAQAQGDYIQWLDADDLLSPEKIEQQMRLIEAPASPRTLLSCGWGHFFYRPARARFTPTPLWEDLTPVEWMIRKWENNAHMQTATWLTSRELTAAAGPWDKQLMSDDDGEYFSRVIMQCDAIKFAPEAKVYYRVTNGSRLSSIGKSDAKKNAMWQGMELQIGYLRSLDDTARARAACVNYLQTWLYHFDPERPDLVERARAMAADLGGTLRVPRLSWKYDWIQKTLGWTATKNARDNFNYWKGSFMQAWDKALFRCEKK